MDIAANRISFGAVTEPRGARHRPAAAASATETIHAVDAVLDLSRGARDLLGVVYGLPEGSLQEFLRLSSGLLRQGIVGTETLKVRGEPYTSFVPARISEPALRDAPLYHARENGQTARISFYA